SRARFWASGDSADKRAAFATLYEVLVDLAKLIAPFTPFLAESLYQNLVRTADPEAPASVHFTDFPKPNDERTDDALRRDLAGARGIVGVGPRVRALAKLKARQALDAAIGDVTDESDRRTVERFQDAIVDELNVEKLGFTSEPEKIVQFQLVPNFRALGP